MKETEVMLNLEEIENRKLESHSQRKCEIESLLPTFETAADLIVSEMALFRKYDREPYVDVSNNCRLIQLRLTVQRKSTKTVSFNWISVSYLPMSAGRVKLNFDLDWHPVDCHPEKIATQFLTLHKDKIRLRFERLLPH